MGVYDEMAARIERLEARVQELEEGDRYAVELAANRNLSPAEKWTLWAIVRKLGRVMKGGEQYAPVEIWQIAKEIGMSSDQTGTLIKKLAMTGVIARKECTVKVETRNNKPKINKQVSLGLTLLTSMPSRIIHPQPRNHGGKREHCEKCGGERLEIYAAYICKDCGHIHQAELKRETKGRRGFVREE
jgi:ribosomal protein S17